MHFSIFHCVLTLQDVFNHTSIWGYLHSSEMKDAGLRVLMLFFLNVVREVSKKLLYSTFWACSINFPVLLWCPDSSPVKGDLGPPLEPLPASVIIITLPYITLPYYLTLPYLTCFSTLSIRLNIGVDL